MQRALPGCVALVVGLLSSRASAGAGDELVHLQTDRTSYRLGETIWFRAHRRASQPIEVVLLGPGNVEVARKELPGELNAPGPASSRQQKKGDTAGTGSFLVPLELAGGAWRLAAYVEGALRHSVDLEVYDLEAPGVLLDLTLLARVHYPGGNVLASFCARERDGSPIRGARVEYRAELAGQVIRDSAGVTDDNGRAVVRFNLPTDVTDDGFLSVGLALPGREHAVARPIFISSSVGSVEAYPETGSVVEGVAGRVALRVLDSRGRPTAAGGRIVDQSATLVTTFQSSPQGLCTVLLPYDVGKRYRAVIDDPAGVNETFPLPVPTADAMALHVETGMEALNGSENSAGDAHLLRVEVRAGPRASRSAGELSLQHAGRVLERATITFSTAHEDSFRSARRGFRRPLEAGLYEVVLERPDQPRIVRPIFIRGSNPVHLGIRPVSQGPLLPGQPVELEVFSKLRGAPVSVDLAVSVHQGPGSGIQDLVLRSELASYLDRTAGALPESLAVPEALDAFLIICAAPRSAGEAPLLITPGAPLVRQRSTPGQQPAHAAPRTESGAGSRTVVRSTALEEKLARAPYTRPVTPPEQESGFRARVSPEAMLAAPHLGKEERAPPQEVDLPSRVYDGRRTLLWAGRVRTGKDGKSILRMKLNHVVSDLTWTAQGFNQGAPVSLQGRLVPIAEFETSIEVPQTVLVGDTLDLLVLQTSRGNGGPIAIKVEHSPALKPLLRTQWTYDPLKDDRRTRLVFQVVEPSAAADLRLIASRGLYEEYRRFQLRSARPSTEVVRQLSGFDRGSRTLEFTVPENAVPGTVHLEANVTPTWLGESEASVESLLTEPTGCFEQTSTKNYVNLLALRTLLELGSDPRSLERGWRLAREGFKKIVGFVDRSSGGFSLLGGKEPNVRATVTGLRQLALHALLFQGEGKRELEAAAHWLESQKLTAVEILHVTHSLHDAGMAWRRSTEAVGLTTRNAYEAVLQAAALAAWPKGVDRDHRLEQRLPGLLDRVERVIAGEARGSDWGVGIMGSSGELLSLEVLGLAANALYDGGRREAAARAITQLAPGFVIPRATQGKMHALRALARITGLLNQSRLDVELTATPGGSFRALQVFQCGPPITFDCPSRLGPGEKGRLLLDIRSDVPNLYRLGYRYEVERPQSSAEAAFDITCTSANRADLGADVFLRLQITPRKPTTSSQVVARVGLPAGLTVTKEVLAELMTGGHANFAEIKDSYLDLYWSKRIAEQTNFEIRAKALVAGTFAARPSMICPYYEAGREGFAKPLSVKINNNFGIKSPETRPPRFLAPR